MSGAQRQAEFHWNLNCFLTKTEQTERKNRTAMFTDYYTLGYKTVMDWGEKKLKNSVLFKK